MPCADVVGRNIPRGLDRSVEILVVGEGYGNVRRKKGRRGHVWEEGKRKEGKGKLMADIVLHCNSKWVQYTVHSTYVIVRRGVEQVKGRISRKE